MSKPISFGFGKPGPAGASGGTGPKPASPAILLPSKKSHTPSSKSKPALRTDDDDELDEDEPKHESVTGFSSSGAILSKPVEKKEALVIENPGNKDWRKRGRGNETRQGEDIVMIEKDEVSTASGLQFAASTNGGDGEADSEPSVQNGHMHKATESMNADEEALRALLGDDDQPRGNTIIEQRANTQLRPHDETDDFRADVAARPDSSTLDDYAAMPVEEFGMAMLRGMGKKRRANGELINFDHKDENPKKFRKQEGFLGIGAKAAPGMDGVELGAWGKADMRKNSKGAGFFTPLMMKNKETGETITEDELERRKQEAKENRNGDDWRDRRDKNLARHGRDKERNGDDKYRDEMNDFSRKRRDERDYESSRSRRDRDDSDYDSSRSRKHRSRSRDHRRRDDDDSDRERSRYEKRREYRDDERYESGSSRRDKERDRDRHRHRDRDREQDRRHERDYDRDDTRYRDKR